MSTVSNIAIVVGLAVVTCGAAAYPVSVYVGQGEFDKAIEKVNEKTFTYGDVTCKFKYTEKEKTFSSRKGDVLLTCNGLDTNIATTTSFSVLSANTEAVVDYNSPSFKELFKYDVVISDANQPFNVDFSYLDKSVNVKKAFSKITYKNPNKENQFIEARDVTIDTKGLIKGDKEANKSVIELINTGKTDGNYAIKAKSIEYKDGNKEQILVDDLAFEGAFFSEGVPANGSLSFSNAVALQDNQQVAAFKNLMFATDILVGDKDTYGYKVGFSFDNLVISSKFNELASIKSKEDNNIDNFNAAISLVDVAKDDFELLLKDRDAAFEKMMLDPNKLMNIQIKDLSFKVNKSPLKVGGYVVMPYSTAITENYMDPKIDMELNLDVSNKFIEDNFSSIKSFVDMSVAQGFVTKDGDSLKSKLKYNKGRITANDKKIM